MKKTCNNCKCLITDYLLIDCKCLLKFCSKCKYIHNCNYDYFEKNKELLKNNLKKIKNKIISDI